MLMTGGDTSSALPVPGRFLSVAEERKERTSGAFAHSFLLGEQREASTNRPEETEVVPSLLLF
jgi:hypothetical protein